MSDTSEQKKLSKTELQQQLFDGLMIDIEPDLLISNREATSEYLETLSKDELDERLAYYEDCMLSFTDMWPEYIEDTIEAASIISEEMNNSLKNQDTNILDDLEKQLSVDSL